MKTFVFAATLLLSAVSSFAQPLPQDCDSESRSLLRNSADSSDKHAQYLLGYQLSVGKCGISDPHAALELLGKSAAQFYAPSLQLLGVIYRREGRTKDAADFFFEAAQRGFHLAEVDLGFLYSELGSSMQNDPAAFAWLSLAIEHEDKPELKNILQTHLSEITARMNESDKTKAERLKANLLTVFGSIPRFNDDP